MKRPEISTHSADPDLVGSEGTTTWVTGRNCVYKDGTEYRVSVLTPNGWKSYGHFNDLETATYIANIAILAERCEGKYELNKGIGDKNRDELEIWRQVPSNVSGSNRTKALQRPPDRLEAEV